MGERRGDNRLKDEQQSKNSNGRHSPLTIRNQTRALEIAESLVIGVLGDGADYSREEEMGKTSKWLWSFLTGKKDKEKEKRSSNQNFTTTSECPATPISIRHNPKEKKRWSFRRATTAVSRDSYPLEMVATTMPVVAAAQAAMDIDYEEQRQGLAIVVAKAAAADAAVAAAIKIQSVFRSYLMVTIYQSPGDAVGKKSTQGIARIGEAAGTS
ncbi:hypothetical protein SDJN02_12720, partial [Cucurbita argyrosperma subsp. argyrosperma]